MVQAHAAISVLVSCECGSRGLVSERLAGRKIRCRFCKTVTRVPYSTAPEPVKEWRTATASGWNDGDTTWSVNSPSENTVVLIPMALESTDELMLLPAHERRSFYQDDLVRRGMRRSPAEARKFLRQSRHKKVNRDPHHERHIRAIGFWNLATGLAVAVGVMIGAFFLGSLNAGAGSILMVVGSIFAGLTFVLGLGLWQLKNWARWITVVFTGLSLLVTVVGALMNPGVAILGTLISVVWDGAILWALLCPRANEIFSASYQQRFERSYGGSVPFWSSPFFWVPAGLICLSGLIVLVLMR